MQKLNSIEENFIYSDELITTLFDKVIIRSKTDVLIIIGDKDVSAIKSNVDGFFKTRINYKIKCTEHYTDFSIYINK